jgi:hypothetical protein
MTPLGLMAVRRSSRIAFPAAVRFRHLSEFVSTTPGRVPHREACSTAQLLHVERRWICSKDVGELVGSSQSPEESPEMRAKCKRCFAMFCPHLPSAA